MSNDMTEAAREAARHASGQFGEQQLADAGTGVLVPLPGVPIVGLPEPERYELLLRSLASYDPSTVKDAFEADTVDEAVEKGLAELAEGEPGTPEGLVPFGCELDLITEADPYPLVMVDCSEYPPEVSQEEHDIRQIGDGFEVPRRTWQVRPGQYLSITPRFFTVAELVHVDSEGNWVEVHPINDSDELARWESEAAGDPHTRVTFRPIRELRVDVHDQPDVAEGVISDSDFDWTDGDRQASREDAVEMLRLLADKFDWADAPSGRWATLMLGR